MVIAAFDVAGGIMVESGLSFLGVGVQPPDASWGSMLLHSRTYVTKAPWLVITPGFFICVTILSIFLLADGLRDALDWWLKECELRGLLCWNFRRPGQALSGPPFELNGVVV